MTMMLLIVMVILLNSRHCLLNVQHLKKFFFHLAFYRTAGVPLITTYKTQSGKKKKNPDDLDLPLGFP